jgi:hypothetical protein
MARANLHYPSQVITSSISLSYQRILNKLVQLLRKKDPLQYFVNKTRSYITFQWDGCNTAKIRLSLRSPDNS